MFSRKSHPRLYHFFIRSLAITTFLVHIAMPVTGYAQQSITSDGTLPTPTRVDITGTNYRISEGTIRGSNQFHSFGRFNVLTGESATFAGPPEIANIISRVTGGELSSIDGLIESEIVGANLYLLNPSGIFFGPNARLDVKGSFHPSTAEFIRLADSGVVYADARKASILTVAPPQAFGFLNGNPAEISVRGSRLGVPDGETLSMVGGNILIKGGDIFAPSGRINLVSVASSGEFGPDLGFVSFERFGEIDILQDGLVRTTGDPAGTVFIRGGSLTLDSSSIFSFNISNLRGGGTEIRLSRDLSLTNRARIACDSYWTGPAGDILIDTKKLAISDESTITSHATSNVAGQGGNITISAAESISISSDSDRGSQSYISCSTFGDGDGGIISISTPILLIDDYAGIFTVAYFGFVFPGNLVNAGNAGDVFLDVRTLKITNGGGISSQTGVMTTGDAGDITICAAESVSLSNSAIHSGTGGEGEGGTIFIEAPTVTLDNSEIEGDTGSYADGNAGDILIEAKDLTLTNGSQISSSTNGDGQGGNVTLRAMDSIFISGRNEDGAVSAVLSSSFGAGDGGTVSLSTPTLAIDDGGLAAQTGSNGDAGDIVVEAEQLTLTNGALISSSSVGSGKGGNIILQAKGMDLLDGATISAKSSGLGDAGNIDITSRDALLLNDSSITTEAIHADGGNIKINSDYMVFLGESEISASVGGGPDTVGGNIFIDPQYVILRNSNITANAFEGRGGNIRIVAGTFLADLNSRVDASSEKGIDGTVDIRAPVKDVSQKVPPLPEDYMRVAELLREACIARIKGGRYSSFVVKGRDGLPMEPGTLLPSPLSVR